MWTWAFCWPRKNCVIDSGNRIYAGTRLQVAGYELSIADGERFGERRVRYSDRDMSRIAGIDVVDSHTEGEPTRLVIAGGPELRGGSLAAAGADGREYDGFRSAVVNEPRGSDVVVGALLVEPEDPACAAGVIFFNNVREPWECAARDGRGDKASWNIWGGFRRGNTASRPRLAWCGPRCTGRVG